MSVILMMSLSAEFFRFTGIQEGEQIISHLSLGGFFCLCFTFTLYFLIFIAHLNIIYYFLAECQLLFLFNYICAMNKISLFFNIHSL